MEGGKQFRIRGIRSVKKWCLTTNGTSVRRSKGPHPCPNSLHYTTSDSCDSFLQWTSYGAPKGAEKCKTAFFPFKIALHLKKVCYKVSLWEYCQQRSCKAFTVLSIRAKRVCRECPLLRENLAETGPPPQQCRFPIDIRPYRRSCNT